MERVMKRIKKSRGNFLRARTWIHEQAFYGRSEWSWKCSRGYFIAGELDGGGLKWSSRVASHVVADRLAKDEAGKLHRSM
jgi:hypothetical protein